MSDRLSNLLSSAANPLLYEDMVQLQQATRRLKLKIRDNCGYGGKIWFDRLETRKRR